MAKSYGFGSIFDSLIKSLVSVAVREGMVQAGLKKPNRGGIKITKTKKLIQGKDKYGHTPNSRKKGH